MTDIENTAEIIPRKLSFMSITSENRSRTTSIIDNFAVDFHTSISSISSIIPTVINETDENDDNVPLFSNRKIYKNLVIISLTFVLMFTAYGGIIALQSSLNTKGNVGVNSLIIINIFILFSSIFLTGISMDIFGLKWTMIIGEIAYILYIVANIRPIPSLMYITAALLGLVSAPLWASQATYISCIARYHAYHKQKKVEDIISLFFGIFFAVYGTTGIWGNLMSYFILNQSNHPQKFNCGIYFNPLSKNDTDSSANVSDLTRYVLCGLFAGMGIVSIILLCFLLDQIRLAKRQPVAQSLKKSLEVIRSFFRWKHIDQLFLVPITMWTMTESTFLMAQFTRAFVTCLVGIRFIGLVLIFNGVCSALSSYVFGALVKYIGRVGCFIIAAILNYAAIILMYLWEPLEDQMYILFIIAGLWGIADAVWQSQVIATYTVLYSETDSSVIAKYRLWKAVGSLVTYGYASYITIQLTLFILFTFLTISMILYGIAEIYARSKNNAKKSDAVLND